MDGQQTTVGVDQGSLRLGPRSVERPADAGITLVGGIDDPSPARVDRGGLISPSGATWTLDWWIGADDRWYLPAREPSVRQRRNGPGPVIETSMRVPSGDVTATAYPAVTGSRRAVVFEVENLSPVPVVLALAFRPVGLDGGPATSHRIELGHDPTTSMASIAVDGRPVVFLPRAPNEAVADGEDDVLDRVEAGQELVWDGPVQGRRPTAACLYPLPHTASLRFVVPTDDRIGPIASDALPPADTVASGWGAVIDRACTFGFPDPGLTDLVAAARARLVLAAPQLPATVEAIDHDAALVLEGLAITGHGDECSASLDRLADAFPTRLPADTPAASGPVAAAAMVRAVAAAADILEPARAEAVLPSAAQLTSLVERRGDGASVAVAKAGLARLAERAGQPDAARHLRSTITGTSGEAPKDLDDVTSLAQLASPSGSWGDDDAVAAARFLAMARGLVLAIDDTSAERPVIDLLPSMPSAWLGGEVEVHRIPAAGIRLSFAIRWHGYRPALLWEITEIDGGVEGLGGAGTGAIGPPLPLLRCSGLDPEWSSDQPSGETLLAGTSIELPAAPGPGDSFQ